MQAANAEAPTRDHAKALITVRRRRKATRTKRQTRLNKVNLIVAFFSLTIVDFYAFLGSPLTCAEQSKDCGVAACSTVVEERRQGNSAEGAFSVLTLTPLAPERKLIPTAPSRSGVCRLVRLISHRESAMCRTVANGRLSALEHTR